MENAPPIEKVKGDEGGEAGRKVAFSGDGKRIMIGDWTADSGEYIIKRTDDKGQVLICMILFVNNNTRLFVTPYNILAHLMLTTHSFIVLNNNAILRQAF